MNAFQLFLFVSLIAFQLLFPLRRHLYILLIWYRTGRWVNLSDLQFSWTMYIGLAPKMLTQIRIIDKETHKPLYQGDLKPFFTWKEGNKRDFSHSKYHRFVRRPSFFVPFAHYLAEKYRKEEGKEIAVYMSALDLTDPKHPVEQVDPSLDLTEEPIRAFTLYPWDRNSAKG